MSDYIKQNSKRYNSQIIQRFSGNGTRTNKSNNCVKQNIFCTSQKFQSYEPLTFGKDVILTGPISCNVQQGCINSANQFQNYVLSQQNLYALMRRRPELFPIITTVKEINLTPAEQRQYSNNWYRQFGTSQALPVNDNWGGFYLPGSDTPWTN